MSEVAQGSQADAMLSLQPREIVDYIVRAMQVVGADPQEAQLGAYAALRAQQLGQRGVQLAYEQLKAFGGNQWVTPVVVSHPSNEMRMSELICPEQHPLRTTLELLDLAAEELAELPALAYTFQDCIAGPLWDELLLRQSVRLQREIVMFGGKFSSLSRIGSQMSVRRVVGGAVLAETAPGQLARFIPDWLVDHHATAVLVLPQQIIPAAQLPAISTKPVPVSAAEWQRIQAVAGKFLVSEI